MQVQDCVFVITGGARGLGLAIGQLIASKGALCAIIDLDEKVAQELHHPVTAAVAVMLVTLQTRNK